MSKNRLVLTHGLLVLAALMAGLARAASPEETVKGYMTALQKHGFESTLDYFHPGELARLKTMIMPILGSGASPKMQPAIEAIFGSGTTSKQLEEMTPLAFGAAFMKFLSSEMKAVKFDDIQVLGSVPEGDLMQVVTRVGVTAGNSVHISQMEVVTTKRYEGGWKLVLTGELEDLAQALKAQ